MVIFMGFSKRIYNAVADLITRSKGLDEIHDDLETVDGVVDSILADTGTTLPTEHTAIEGKVDTVDANIDTIKDTDLPAVKTDTAAILADTGTTIPATLGTPAADVSADIAAVKADTDSIQNGVWQTLEVLNVQPIQGNVPVFNIVGHVLAHSFAVVHTFEAPNAALVQLGTDGTAALFAAAKAGNTFTGVGYTWDKNGEGANPTMNPESEAVHLDDNIDTVIRLNGDGPPPSSGIRFNIYCVWRPVSVNTPGEIIVTP